MANFILKEDGGYLLQENGDKLILEEITLKTTTDFSQSVKVTTDLTNPSKLVTDVSTASKITTDFDLNSTVEDSYPAYDDATIAYDDATINYDGSGAGSSPLGTKLSTDFSSTSKSTTDFDTV